MDITTTDLAQTIGQLHLQILDLQGKNAKLQAELNALENMEPVNSEETNQ